MNNIRNVAIIAHVDHGKTTLVDALLRQSQTHLSKAVQEKGDLIMDSNDLERERGITIFSKNASINWKNTKINIIDTPGHADFGGEVERVLKMADGALLLVDAKEGPMPQTRFVLKKAPDLGHKVIVVINKIDKPDARISHVLNKTFDLFLELGADEETSFFPTIYSSGKQGKAGLEADLSKMDDISPLFDAVLEHIPSPLMELDKPLQILITNTNYDNFKGRIATKELFGYRSQFVTDTKGLGIISSSFFEYKVDSGSKFQRNNGSLVVHESGTTKLYALVGAQNRGDLFIGPGTQVYRGQVIGQNSREDDIRINVCKEKQQTNHRSSGEGTAEHFNAPKIMSLENAIEYIDDTELVEVTPKNIRIRKINLDG